jgi:hypothetical protein
MSRLPVSARLLSHCPIKSAVSIKAFERCLTASPPPLSSEYKNFFVLYLFLGQWDRRQIMAEFCAVQLSHNLWKKWDSGPVIGTVEH